MVLALQSEVRRPWELTTGPLVTASWLRDHLDDPRVRVVDVRGRVLPEGAPGPRLRALSADYAAAHLPRAHFLDWTRHLVPRALVPSTWHDPLTSLRAALQRMGVARYHTVVLYDDAFSLFASRASLVLRALGWERARVLDGGLAQWRDEGFALTARAPAFADDAPAPFALDESTVLGADTEELLRALRHGAVIDARLPAAFEGRVGEGSRRGHIPGAVNVPFNRVVCGANGRFGTPTEIRRALDDAGLDRARLAGDVVVYCDTGAMASAVCVALDVAGISHAKVYEPGFGGWSADPTRAVAQGPASSMYQRKVQ